jgi:hypothetical protein
MALFDILHDNLYCHADGHIVGSRKQLPGEMGDQCKHILGVEVVTMLLQHRNQFIAKTQFGER